MYSLIKDIELQKITKLCFSMPIKGNGLLLNCNFVRAVELELTCVCTCESM